MNYEVWQNEVIVKYRSELFSPWWNGGWFEGDIKTTKVVRGYKSVSKHRVIREKVPGVSEKCVRILLQIGNNHRRC